MKKKLLLLIMIGLVVPLKSMAQTKYVQITKFERNYTSLKASVTPVKDNAGEECAMIRFWYSDQTLSLNPIWAI